MKKLLFVAFLLSFPMIILGQIRFKVDSIQLFTLQNVNPEESVLHDLYTDIIWNGPILEIYGRLINTSSLDLVIQALHCDNTGDIVSDINLKYYTTFEYKGKQYKTAQVILAPFHQTPEKDILIGLYNGRRISYSKLSSRKYIKGCITTAFLFNQFGFSPKKKYRQRVRLNRKLARIAHEVLPTIDVVVEWEMAPDVQIETGGDPSKYQVTPII